MNSTTVNNSNDAFSVSKSMMEGITNAYTTKIETPAIYLGERYRWDDNKVTGILREGTGVRIENGKLVDGKITHEVTSMRCNMVGSNPDITVVNLDTFELINIGL